MATRPLVSIYSAEKEKTAVGSTVLPAIFTAPIRPDVVNYTHSRVRMNKRQPYAVSENAGHQHSAESWGTGRAVARIPRVSGGGTHRAGQGAFGNMCRSGRMFNPTKIWRRWHRRVNENMKRHAVASAIAASSVPALVMARGHRIGGISEIPLVVSDDIQTYTKTKAAVAFLKRIRAYGDVQRVKASRALRAGNGKARNRRHVQRKGPLIVYKENKGLTKAFRGVPGVEVCKLESLNILRLAPGGHLGRFVIWTESAFKALDERFGGYKAEKAGSLQHGTKVKRAYRLPTAPLETTDITRIMQSDAIQNVIRPAKLPPKRTGVKKNPLKNLFALAKLNPYAVSARRSKIITDQKRRQAKLAARQAKSAGTVKPMSDAVKAKLQAKKEALKALNASKKAFAKRVIA